MESEDNSADRIARVAYDQERLEALQSYDILDTPPEPAFDRIVRLIKRTFDIPIAIVSVIDAHRQWYKAYDGMSNSEAALGDTFCRFTMIDGKSMIICNATEDARVSGSPYVTGGPNIRFYASSPLITPGGHIIGTICAIDSKPRDFSERETAILEDIAAITMDTMEMRRLAETDALTGVMSRRGLMDAGRLALMRTRRARQDLTCVTLDIDHFKAINDRFGHAGGDKVLEAVVAACTIHLREIDHFGRIGGEEFAILLENTDARGGVVVAEKLRKAIEALEIVRDGNRVPVTASFGVASQSQAGGDLAALLGVADANLYAAKREGRNRTKSSLDEAQAVEPRRRVLKAGVIIFNDRRSTIDCTIRSMSSKSAGIDVTGSTIIPAKFTLAIRSEGFETPCRIVSQTEKHLEVEFG